ncbi:MAG: glycosyltransferase [Candidatus Omnitrophota bacterium]
MKKILIIAFSDLENDPRVYRQIMYLKDAYDVTTVGWNSANIEGVRFFPIAHIKRSRLGRMWRAMAYKFHRYENLYWSIYDFKPLVDELPNERFDLIIANDVDTLPFAFRIAGGAKVLLDTHEYAPGHFEDRWVWRFFFQGFNRYLCETYMPRCDRMITVSSGVADEYKKNYGFELGVITNAEDYVKLDPTPVDSRNIRIITHGVSNPNRKLELMIRVMDYLDERFQLDLMLLPTYPRYYKKLQRMARKRSNVRIIPPVSRKEIIPFTNRYDLSFIMFKPTTVNLRCGLFNKFFESIQARLGIISGPFPEAHVELVNRYMCGIVLNTYEPREIARELNRLTADWIMEFKIKANIAACELTAEKNMALLKEMVDGMINGEGNHGVHLPG